MKLFIKMDRSCEGTGMQTVNLFKSDKDGQVFKSRAVFLEGTESWELSLISAMCGGGGEGRHFTGNTEICGAFLNFAEEARKSEVEQLKSSAFWTSADE